MKAENNTSAIGYAIQIAVIVVKAHVSGKKIFIEDDKNETRSEIRILEFR